MNMPDLTRRSNVPGRTPSGVARSWAQTLATHAVLIITAIAGLVLAIGLTVASGSIYGAVVDNDGIAALDQPTLDQAVQQRTETNVQVVTWFTHLGGPVGMTVIAALITVVMVWRWRSRTPLILMVIAVAGSLTLTTVGKNLVGRARPPLDYAVPPYEYAFSFPSGHALNSTVIAGVVAYLVVRRLKTSRAKVLTVVVAAVWAIAMGLSRVFLGHHWLTDVTVAWLIGGAWLAVLITAHQVFLVTRRRPRPDSERAAAITTT
jgi:membrane-associated phospholipid phosphatase